MLTVKIEPIICNNFKTVRDEMSLVLLINGSRIQVIDWYQIGDLEWP